MFAFALLAGGMLLLSVLYLHLHAHTLVLRSSGARRLHFEDAPQLHHATSHLSAGARIPWPTLFVIRNRRPDAFSVGGGRSGGIVVTTGAVRRLTGPQLEAMIAHQIAHLAMRHTWRTTPIALVWTAVAAIQRWLGPNRALTSLLAALHRFAHPAAHDEAADMMAVRLLGEASVLLGLLERSRRYDGDAPRLARAEVAAANAGLFRSPTIGAFANSEWDRRIATVRKVAADRERRMLVHRPRRTRTAVPRRTTHRLLPVS